MAANRHYPILTIVLKEGELSCVLRVLGSIAGYTILLSLKENGHSSMMEEATKEILEMLRRSGVAQIVDLYEKQVKEKGLSFTMPPPPLPQFHLYVQLCNEDFTLPLQPMNGLAKGSLVVRAPFLHITTFNPNDWIDGSNSPRTD